MENQFLIDGSDITDILEYCLLIAHVRYANSISRGNAMLNRFPAE